MTRSRPRASRIPVPISSRLAAHCLTGQCTSHVRCVKLTLHAVCGGKILKLEAPTPGGKVGFLVAISLVDPRGSGDGPASVHNHTHNLNKPYSQTFIQR